MVTKETKILTFESPKKFTVNMIKNVDKRGVKRYTLYLTHNSLGFKDKKFFVSKSYDDASREFFKACEHYRKKIIL